MTIDHGETENKFWNDDLLDRGRYADFLTNYIDAKVQPDKPGMVMALDAPWGSGKTFFINRWANQLRSHNHAVLVFDAWQNDSAEDPVVSFMAELRSGLVPIIDKLPIDTALSVELKAKSKNMIGNLRKATISTAKVVGIAALKKATGVAVGDLLDAWSNTEEAPKTDEEKVVANSAGSTSKDGAQSHEVIEKGLDDFFAKTLQGHAQRLQAVSDFRQSLQDLLKSLRKAQLMDGPLYVFIDELDRCRPNYAISLLEGVKHLFSVEGVAFVVSTNLDQLSKAIGAVYGSNFDGAHYLKRFFDFEYELPEPTRVKFIKARVAGTTIEKITGHSGLDTRLRTSPSDVASGFAVISEAMRIDLRSLDRIITSVEAVVANLPKDRPIACLWLFFLTALRYRYQQDFNKIASHNTSQDDFKKLCDRIFVGPKTVPGISFHNVDGMRRRREGNYELSEALWVYCRSAIEGVEWIEKAFERIDPQAEPYPVFLLTTVYHGWQFEQNAPHPIDRYANLISMAGHVQG